MEGFGNNFKIHHIIWFVETLRKILFLIPIEKVQTWPKKTFRQNRIAGFIYRTWKNVRLYHRKITRTFIVSVNFLGLYQTWVFSTTEGSFILTSLWNSVPDIYRSNRILTQIWPAYVWNIIVFVNYSSKTCKQVLMNLY